MRILVTGGTGFYGKHIALRLQAEGHEVAVLGRNAGAGAALREAGLRFIQADMAEQNAVFQAVRGHEQVIHCAALAAPQGRYAEFYQANVVATEHLIKAALAHRVARLVHISTPSLYFDYRSRVGIKESDPLPRRQHTHYAATKLLADQAVHKAGAAGLPWIAVRPRAIIGAGDQNVLPRLLQAGRGGAFPLVGDGQTLVDLTCIDNAVEAVRLCVHAPSEALAQTYNISNGEPMSVRSMVEQVYGALDLPVRFRGVPYPLAYAAAAAFERYYQLFKPQQEPPLSRYGVGLMAHSQTLDLELARTGLGYQPRTPLTAGIAQFAAWWRSQAQH